MNILASKLTEIVDVPSKQNLAIFGPGTIIGEEDFVSRQYHSCTLKCHSMTGKLFKVTPELFELLKNNQPEQIMDQIIIKESWKKAKQLKN